MGQAAAWTGPGDPGREGRWRRRDLAVALIAEGHLGAAAVPGVLLADPRTHLPGRPCPSPRARARVRGHSGWRAQLSVQGTPPPPPPRLAVQGDSAADARPAGPRGAEAGTPAGGGPQGHVLGEPLPTRPARRTRRGCGQRVPSGPGKDAESASGLGVQGPLG